MVALAMDSQQDKLLMVLDPVTDARVFLIYNLQRMTTRGYRTRLVLPMRCWTVNHRTTRKGKPLPEKMSSQLQFRLNCSTVYPTCKCFTLGFIIPTHANICINSMTHMRASTQIWSSNRFLSALNTAGVSGEATARLLMLRRCHVGV